MLSQWLSMMKFSLAISQVKWLSGEKKKKKKKKHFEDHLCPQGTWQTSTLRKRTEMVFKTLVFFTVWPFDPADRPRKLHQRNFSHEAAILAAFTYHLLQHFKVYALSKTLQHSPATSEDTPSNLTTTTTTTTNRHCSSTIP
jgi:hypothetical protein